MSNLHYSTNHHQNQDFLELQVAARRSRGWNQALAATRKPIRSSPAAGLTLSRVALRQTSGGARPAAPRATRCASGWAEPQTRPAAGAPLPQVAVHIAQAPGVGGKGVGGRADVTIGADLRLATDELAVIVGQICGEGGAARKRRAATRAAARAAATGRRVLARPGP